MSTRTAKPIYKTTRTIHLGMGCVTQVNVVVSFDPEKLDTAITRAALNKSKRAVDANGALIIEILGDTK